MHPKMVLQSKPLTFLALALCLPLPYALCSQIFHLLKPSFPKKKKIYIYINIWTIILNRKKMMWLYIYIPEIDHQSWHRKQWDQERQESRSHRPMRFGGHRRRLISRWSWSEGRNVLQIRYYCYRSRVIDGSDWFWKVSHFGRLRSDGWRWICLEYTSPQLGDPGARRLDFLLLPCNHSQHNCVKKKVKKVDKRVKT